MNDLVGRYHDAVTRNCYVVTFQVRLGPVPDRGRIVLAVAGMV